MNKKQLSGILTVCLFIFAAQIYAKDISQPEKARFIKENIEFAELQTQKILRETGEPTGKNYPRTTNKEGSLSVNNMYAWTSGFFPGSLWYLYELSGDTVWRNYAEKWTESLEPLKTFTDHHDLGFMMYCSYGNGYRLTGKIGYKEIIEQSARSLSTRYSDKTKAIKSWNIWTSWDGASKGYYPVIIDNMMNLELLIEASKMSDDKLLYNIALIHANTTIKNHFRSDFGTYHVVDYDTINGSVRHQATAQGYSDNSTWARGQAWAIYGYTMMYRETGDKTYLDVAVKATDFYLSHLPQDLIPVWDFNVGQEGYNPQGRSKAVTNQSKLRDTSAAAIVCSALFELGKYVDNKGYTDKAIKMLHNLSSPQYRAQPGANGGFILMHSVGSIPHGFEVDTPIVYTDYYFLEALVRYKNLK